MKSFYSNHEVRYISLILDPLVNKLDRDRSSYSER